MSRERMRWSMVSSWAGGTSAATIDLALGIDQRIEGVAELLLHRLALQELEIVDEQHIDRTGSSP